MRVCLVFNAVGDVILPIHYNHLVQAMIYKNISKDLADFLHDRGFLLGKRRFKLFTFSRLNGRFTIDGTKGRITYHGDLSLQISSPIERFVADITNSIMKRGSIILGGNKLTVKEMAFPASFEARGEKVTIRMLSPLTVYSTLMTPDGRKKTYYYSPYEKEFSELVSINAKKKHFLLTGRVLKSGIKISPLKVKEVVVIYKGNVVKGWMGTFALKGPLSLIKTVYEAGLGAKNPQGFGMFEVVECSSR
jgi:CRISPR-associated endoribonuclease Cas6